MESNKQHFRHILLFYYRKGKNAIQTRKKLTDMYGKDVLTVRQCQNWFAKFRSGNFDVEDTPRSGSERLNLSNSTVYDHLKGLGLTSKLDIWVSHVLTERNLCRRVDICDSLLKRHENDPFLKRIITGDEKWVVYNNVQRKRSWSKKDEPAQSISKANIHQKKLDKLNDALQQKRSELINRKGVVFHQDNVIPHISLVSRQKLLQLEWITMPYPPYFPDLVQNFLDHASSTLGKGAHPRTTCAKIKPIKEVRAGIP
ncbi:histone-lysine N-methyltransferase SETMAR-like [Vespa crabro]|uniref:histone-lysine N-methyltransferase SETMAR-like n=1 Tax=Vespa crabro TaxID=7445 RepID=UPI001F02427C|nr:histone-lysine N-methyltransferase SETMAR-like [Vespa crabro]